MRALTPDVESALRWFEWTHALVIVPMVGARYERNSWPAAGGAGDQEAWLTQALTWLRRVYNAMLREEIARTSTRPKEPMRHRGRRR